MTETAWLKRYYGADFPVLNPSVLFEGKTRAVVMLRSRVRGLSQVGYVLVDKTGRHNVTRHEALHEGPASPVELSRMKERLAEVD